MLEGLSIFQMVAIGATFNVTDFRQWQQNQEIEQSQQEQRLSETQHSNHVNHVNGSIHTNFVDHTNYVDHGNHTNHSNRSTHTNHFNHTNTFNHSNHNAYGQNFDQDASRHYNFPGSHNNTHDNTYSHIQHFQSGGHSNVIKIGHYNKHINQHGHVNGAAHWNKHTNHQNHSNSFPHDNRTNHSNQFGHDNRWPHSNHNNHQNLGRHTNTTAHNNTTPHNNVGFDHSNYIPYKPAIYPNIKVGKKISGVVVIGLYSYDKDINRSDAEIKNYVQSSRTVKYTLKIRKFGKLNWETLLDRSTQDTYHLNTQNLEEGQHEIEVFAINDTISVNNVTKEYVSDVQKITVEVVRNHEPVLTVLNGDEWINFYFNQQGAISPGGVFTSYIEGLYADAEEHQKEGLFVKLNLRDEDTDQYHWGRVYLEGIPGAETEIFWKYTDVSPENVTRTGVAFIPKEAFVGRGQYENIQVFIEVRDYLDADYLLEAGGNVAQTTVSAEDLTQMIILVDADWGVKIEGSKR
jgi:hypothetical protein